MIKRIAILIAVLAFCVSSDVSAQKNPTSKAKGKEPARKVDQPDSSGASEVEIGRKSGSTYRVTPIDYDVHEPGVDEYIPDAIDPEPLTDVYSLLRFSEMAKSVGAEGYVVVAVLIDTDGTIDSTHVVMSTNALFEQSAVDAMKQMRFKPGTLDGRPITMWYRQRVFFEIQN